MPYFVRRHPPIRDSDNLNMDMLKSVSLNFSSELDEFNASGAGIARFILHSAADHDYEHIPIGYISYRKRRASGSSYLLNQRTRMFKRRTM